MGIGILIGLVLTAISLVYFWIRKKYSFFEDNGFLHEKPHFPFGNLKGVGKDFHIINKVKEYYGKFKRKAPLFGMYFFINSNVVITDLDLIKSVMIKDFDSFRNRGLYSNVVDDPLTGHLFLIEDEAWKSMRSKLTPTFTSGKMKMMFNTLLEISDLMVSQLQDVPNLDMIEMKNVLANFTTDVIGNIAFGLEMNSIKDPDAIFRKMGKKVLGQNNNVQFRAFFLTSFKDLGRKLHMRFLPKDVSDFFLTTIRETVDHRLKHNIQRNDVMDLLLKLKDNGTKEEDKITFNELAAQCFIWFVAGFETSSSTASFVLYVLSLHQDIQEKLRNEIKNILTKHNGDISYEAMQEMKYLQMVIDETLRMYGPVPQLIRTASRDYKVPNTNLTIPKGTLTLIPIHVIHMDSDIYPEPEKFDPERFSDENKRDRHPMAYMPFGEGPRNCIGLRFGLMQTKVSLIKLLTNFKFSTSTRTTIPMEFNPKTPLLSPQNDMWLSVEKI